MTRTHLLKCFMSRDFTPFPNIEMNAPRKINPLSRKIDVYCMCLITHLMTWCSVENVGSGATSNVLG